jgi:hypothetical protein
MAITESIFIGIVTSVIYDTLKYIFSEPNGREIDDDTKEIADFLKKKDFSQFDTLFDSSIFQKYIKLPQVRDVIYNYVFYLINRKKNKNLKEHEICAYLADGLLKRYDSQITIPPKAEIESFFKFLFSCIDEYFLQLLSKKDRYMLSTIHQAINVTTVETHEKIDVLVSLIKKSLDIKIQEEQNTFIQTKREYMNTLQDKNKRAHIYLLDYFDLNKFYVPPILKHEKNNSMLTLFRLYGEKIHIPENYIFELWKSMFRSSKIVYIIGGAGYGKSLFMKNIINNYNLFNIPDSQDHLVIYGEIKKFIEPNSYRQKSMLEFLQESMIASTGIDGQRLSKEFIQYYLDLGRCIILLDALDEVDKSRRRDLHETMIAFFNNSNPNNKICITSRDRGFIPIGDKTSCFKILPLERRQIEKYVDNIIRLKKFAESDKKSFLKQADKLIEKRFLNSFLVLSLLINIYKAERELPENKLELYQKCFEYIATKREKEKIDVRFKGDQFDWDVIGLLMKDNTFIELANLTFPNNMDISKDKIKQHLIQIYKFKYGNEAKADNAIEEFLNFCSERTELFVPTLEEKFKFFHRTFFEYFYSLFIFTRCEKIEEIYSKMEQFDIDSEVFELTIAMFKKSAEEKYQKIIELVFDIIDKQFDHTNKNFVAFNMLILMFQVIDDVVYTNNFIKLLVNFRELIFNNPDKINNTDIIVRLVVLNENYTISVNDAYYYYSMAELFLFIARFDDFLLKIREVNNININFDSVNKNSLIYYISTEAKAHSQFHFYTEIFIQTRDLYDEFHNIKIENIESIINNRKINSKIIKGYKKYKNFDDEKKKNICSLISEKK